LIDFRDENGRFIEFTGKMLIFSIWIPNFVILFNDVGIVGFRIKNQHIVDYSLDYDNFVINIPSGSKVGIF
jgi:hypothetical protein